MNVFCFTGNLGHDSELKFLPSGSAVCEFSVAVKSGYGEHEKTSWIKCALFGKRGESLGPYLTKGKHVAVTGEYVTQQYEGKDGNMRYIPSCRVANIDLLGGRDGGQGQGQGSAPKQQGSYQPPAAGQPAYGSDDDSDIPF